MQIRKGTIGYMLAHEQFPVQELREIGTSAARCVFGLLATSDHFQPWQANEDHSGEALNEEVATGEWPGWKERWDRLVEAIAVIRALWSGKDVDHQGKFYTVKGKLYDVPPQPIPILTAANGPKAIKLAGEHGDGLITDPETWAAHKTDWEASARRAGKNPKDMPVLVEQYVAVGNKAVAEQAAELWRFIPKAFKGYHAIRDPAEIQRRAEAEVPLGKVMSSWPIGNDPKRHIEAIEKLFDSGATIVNIHAAQNDHKSAIEFYGSKVLPHFHQAAA